MQRSPYKYTQNTYDRGCTMQSTFIFDDTHAHKWNAFCIYANFRANLYIFSYRLAVNFILNWNFIIYFRND